MLRIVGKDGLNGIRPSAGEGNFSSVAADIIARVKSEGDAALVELTRRFDWPEMTEGDIEVDLREAKEALAALDPEVRIALELAAQNISKFHIAQRPASWSTMNADGTRLGQKMVPLKAAGVYVPGGSAAYPSTVLMCVLAAKAAGVPEIFVCTPPGKDGSLNKATLAAAALSGATRVFRVGGAQAIAALAYGTKTIPGVDVIAGPGNAYVTAAKKAVMGDVRIDMLAGPSEVMVVADETADPAFIAADLIAQAEHDELACCTLITTSTGLWDEVLGELGRQLKDAPRRSIAAKSLERYSAAVIAESLDEAIEIADSFAPEHLEICCRDSARYAEKASNAGTIFVGSYSAEAMGDYVAGPSHVLPTMGTARFRGTLSTADFMKSVNVVEYSREGFAKEAPAAEILAFEEGLFGHGASVSVRRMKLARQAVQSNPTESVPVIKLDANECSMDVPSGDKARMLASLMDMPFNRYPSADSDGLRKALAEKFGMETSRFLIGVGSDELILVLMLALRGKVDKVVSPWPSFSMYKVISAICGLPFEEIAIGEDGLPEGKALDAALFDDRALVFLCVPNNPTGDSMEGFIRERITGLDGYGAYVAIDQAYAEFCGSDMSDLATGRTVVLRTFSKARRLAGLRVGYSIASPEMTELMRSAKLPYNVPSICEELARLSLEDKTGMEDYLGQNAGERQKLGEALNGMGMSVRGGSCNFVLAECKGDEGARLADGLRGRGVLVRDFRDRQDLMRVTVGTPEENGRVIGALSAALEDVKGGKPEGAKGAQKSGEPSGIRYDAAARGSQFGD